MIGSLISGVLGLGSSIFGGIKASQAMKKYEANIKQQQQDNKSWYNRRYNEDSTQRADAQRVMTRTSDLIRKRNRAAAADAAVMGGTEASAAATKATNADALADATSRIAVAGDARKDGIESQYRAAEAGYQDRLADLQLGKAQTTVQAVNGVVESAGKLGEAIEDAAGMAFGGGLGGIKSSLKSALQGSAIDLG